MAIRDIKDLLEAAKGLIDDSTQDAALSFFEDLIDTYSAKNDGENEDWKKKFEENDKMWREKYRDRFFHDTVEERETEEEVYSEGGEDGEKKYRYEELFKEEKEG